ncbi:Putative uncharacterized protein [Taphrina deformans PYCC 5710]|uniref:Short chain dehydrogenase/reductase family n=1 Tax=Taphrina deformans (strain PYCC 5710 / ATCC 11124 / CBS 356.35 / IMI 108563 / JCM 9778 / NBRC 8474) TaxID=1097556 RepID=R4XHS5_TAPDE|nr:Putative uncharacterized protein [Taphrina deformans PYCC 5710]|eukprot:CCG82967.1 Putative uncharacterized protein [Taphrina deformans PYCC 5710]
MSISATSINDMSGLSVIVTGAGTGIGLMIGRTYVSHGATVYLVGRRREKLEEAVTSIEELKAPGKAVILQGDVSTQEGQSQLLSDYQNASGQDHIDVLVCNAGIYRGESKQWSPTLSVDEMSAQFLASEVDDWAETANVNVTSQYFLIGRFLPLLAKAKDGNVVVTSSIAGVHYSASSSNPSYSASKAAINHLVKLMANRLAPLYIRINAIAPGMFPSEMNNAESQKRLAPAVQKIPAKRLGNERDMGQAALFLSMCRYCDGQILVVDGGRSLGANGQ